jgi:hypothetical protein
LVSRDRRATRLTGWMRHIPIVGRLCFNFWHGMLSEGPRVTCQPRWGSITFAFLNDGCRPTLWHTYWQMTHDQLDPYTGIYPRGAPKSLRQAQEWEREWRQTP